MSVRLKSILLNCIADSYSSANAVKRFERSGAYLKLTHESTKRLSGTLTFRSDEEEKDNEILSGIANNLSKISEAAQSRSFEIYNCEIRNRSLNFKLDLENFITHVLNNDPTELIHKSERKKLIIEHSSPNIAKNFHIGHFRSTIIGNFLVNLKRKLGHEVLALNYLGDWGLQVGKLLYGIESMGLTEEQLKQDTMSKLQDVYVATNKMSFNGTINLDTIKALVSRMEKGDEEIMKRWKMVRDLCEKNLSSMYKELNVSFDEYAWESTYNKRNVEPFLKTLDSKIGLQTDSEGRTTVNVGGDAISLIKSDGSTLYILRDIAAYFDRSKRHNFDEMLYVVDEAQTQHFESLKKVCSVIQGNDAPLRHVTFGRVQNMSTRKGSYTLFKDLLDDAQQKIYENMKNTRTTKGDPDLDIAKTVAFGALVINDLQYVRKRQYIFDLASAVHSIRTFPVQCQYTHCRLFNILKTNGLEPAEEVKPGALMEPEAVNLILDISDFESALLEADDLLESYILVNFLAKLVKSSNSAIQKLRVNGAENDLARQRVILYNAARRVMAEILTILGCKPLEYM